MKTRRFIAVFAALTMAAAIGSTGVFAAEPTTVVPGTDGNPTPESAGFEVKYDVDPSYTVTIPAGVDITTEDKTDSITLNEGALLEEGSKIKVVLEKGANTTSGNSFTAKTASGNSSASYQITQGENTVSVGDTVASLDKDTLSASLTFSKTETIKPTYAGTHAEVLTFTVSVEGGSAPIAQKTLTIQKTSLTAAGLQVMEGTLSLDYTSANKWSDVCTAMSQEDFMSIGQSMSDGRTVSVDTGWYSTSIPTFDVEFSGVLWIDAQDGIYMVAMLDTENKSVEPVVPDSEILEDTQYVAIAQILVNH